MTELDAAALDILERVADGVVVVDGRGRIVYATRRACDLFEYEPHDLIGQPVEVLVPEPTRDVHARVRGEFSSAPGHREMGSGLPLEGRRKDGSIVALDIRLEPMPSAPFVVASIRRSPAPALEAAVADRHRRDQALRAVLDTVTQHLFAIGMSLTSLEASATGAIAAQLASSTALLDRTIELVRAAQAPPEPDPA